MGLAAPTPSTLASVSDAIERLQRERDLALRRNEELHAHHKKEMQAASESHERRTSTLNRDYIQISGDLELARRQLDQVQSLCDTQNLMIKRLQEQLGEEAEFEPDMDPHVRRVHLDYEGRIEDYEERIRQLESEMQEDEDEQSKAIEKLRRERTLASSEISRTNQAMDKMRTEQVAMRSKNTEDFVDFC